MSLYTKSGAIWQVVKSLFVKDSGSWKQIKAAWVKDAGLWKMFYSSAKYLFAWEGTMITGRVTVGAGPVIYYFYGYMNDPKYNSYGSVIPNTAPFIRLVYTTLTRGWEINFDATAGKPPPTPEQWNGAMLIDGEMIQFQQGYNDGSVAWWVCPKENPNIWTGKNIPIKMITP